MGPVKMGIFLDTPGERLPRCVVADPSARQVLLSFHPLVVYNQYSRQADAENGRLVDLLSREAQG
jgi:hypothetical protein